jgi:hypothetical protein
MICVVHRTPQSHSLLGTCFRIIFLNHFFLTSRITPSAGFWFDWSGLVAWTLTSFLRQHFMNSVPGPFCSLDPSTVSSSGTPRSISNFLSAWPASFFDAIGCISAKKVPFENAWPCRFPSKDFTRPSIASDAHFPSNRFVWRIVCRLDIVWLVASPLND